MFQATPQRRLEVRQSRLQIEGSRNFDQERAGREGAGIVPDGAREDRRDGKEHEDGDQRDDEADRRDHEGVAPAPAARREPVAEQHQEGDGR